MKTKSRNLQELYAQIFCVGRSPQVVISEMPAALLGRCFHATRRRPDSAFLCFPASSPAGLVPGKRYASANPLS
jgi:hypothetical protein